MRATGHLTRRFFLIVYCGCLMTMINSCAALNAPLVNRPGALRTISSTSATTPSIWVLDSLTPGEHTVLFRRHTIPVAIYLEAHGEGHYLLQFSANKKHYKPLPYIFVNSGGELDFASRVTKCIKPKGKVVNISVALYRIEKSESGKTEVCTLLKQIQREYVVKRRRDQKKRSH